MRRAPERVGQYHEARNGVRAERSKKKVEFRVQRRVSWWSKAKAMGVGVVGVRD